jgi:hypothetical protein
VFVAGGAEQKKVDSSAKRTDIRRMMDLSGAGKLGVQVMNQMISAFKQSMPGVPDKFWKDFMAEVDPNELVEMAIPSYDKYFTHDDIKELIKFYESPVGKKLTSVQPQIMQECMTAGQEWGRKLGEKVAKKLQEQGYK